jgi:hypothetical protein
VHQGNPADDHVHGAHGPVARQPQGLVVAAFELEQKCCPRWTS